MDVIVDTFARIEADDTVNDVDRKCVGVRVKACRNNPRVLSPSDVVDTLVECINDEQPTLRYQVPRELAQQFATVLADSTGETAVALKEKTIKE